MRMKKTLFSTFIHKIVNLEHRLETIKAKSFTKSETPELIGAYQIFNKASQSGAPRQPHKGWDLWRLLEKYKPKSIVELGSGTTSAAFALWAKRNNAKYICYEHHAEWAKVTEDCLREAGLVEGESPVHVVESRLNDDSKSIGFVESLPDDVDFIYVDGPPCSMNGSGKLPNNDVNRLLQNGGKPTTIVIDGRVDTVDYIRSHEFGKNYKFEPSYVYALSNGLWSEALKNKEHSILSLN